MTDHDHTPDPSNDPSNDPSRSDERIDALARAAGSQLRRPAPADGIARVQRAKRRRQTAQLGGVGVAAVAILAVGALAIGGGDAGPTVVPATVSTLETPDTTEPTGPNSTIPNTAVPGTTDSSPPTSEPPDTPGSVPGNTAGAPSVVYTAAQFASFGSEVSEVDPFTGEVISTTVLDEAASEVSRAAQDALRGRTAMVPRVTGGSSGTARNGQVDSGWFTYEFDVGDLGYAFDLRPTEIQDLDQFSTETLARFDRCGQSRVRVTGVADAALPEFASALALSSDARWVVTTSVDCDEPGTLADGPTTVERPRIVTIYDAARPESPGRELADDVEPFDQAVITFSPNGDFVSIDSNRFFDTASGAEIALLPATCDAFGTKWSRFIGPWIGESSVALQVTCGGAASLVVRDLDTGEMIDVKPPIDVEQYGLVADVDFAHFDRPVNVWFTWCASIFDADTSATSNRCWVGQGEGPLLELVGAAEASFLPLGFSPGG